LDSISSALAPDFIYSYLMALGSIEASTSNKNLLSLIEESLKL